MDVWVLTNGSRHEGGEPYMVLGNENDAKDQFEKDCAALKKHWEELTDISNKWDQEHGYGHYSMDMEEEREDYGDEGLSYACGTDFISLKKFEVRQS